MLGRIFGRGAGGGETTSKRREQPATAPSTAMTRWLRQGLKLGICPLCRVAHKADREYIWHFSEEGFGHPETLAAFAAARGFCAEHAAQLEAIDLELKSMLGVSSIYVELFADLDAELALLALERPFTCGRCPACVNRAQAVHRNARYLLAELAEPRGVIVHAYPDSAGLCFPHFHQTWELGGPPQARTLLLEVQRRVAHQILVDLREFIRKEGAEARAEPRGAEQGAWQRAIWLTAGWPAPRGSAAVPESATDERLS